MILSTYESYDYPINSSGKIEKTDHLNSSKTQNPKPLNMEPATGEQRANYSTIFKVSGLIGIIILIVLFFIFIFIKKKQDKTENLTLKNPVEMQHENPTNSAADFTREEVKVISVLAIDGSTENEISKKLGAGASYTLEKLKQKGIIYFDAKNNTNLRVELKPKFIFEHILGKEEKDIVMILKKHGRLKQIEITAKVKFSRTTVSRRLTDLEKLNIVVRCADGTSKKVELSPWFRDNL